MSAMTVVGFPLSDEKKNHLIFSVIYFFFLATRGAPHFLTDKTQQVYIMLEKQCTYCIISQFLDCKTVRIFARGCRAERGRRICTKAANKFIHFTSKNHSLNTNPY